MKPREDVDTGVQAAPPFWLRIVLRAALLALVGLGAEAFLTERSEFRHKLGETQPTTGYAIETTATKAAPAVNHPVTEVSPTATAPITVDMIASPLRSVADQPAALQLTTIPAGATFEVTITSVPNGAEILCGTVSLGFTPLTAALPAGNHVLTARLKNYPDRTQNVTVNENATSTIEFQMRVRRHIARAKPTPSFLGKVGGSLKHLFGGNSTPPPRRKR